ncbi:hypothetical protein FJR48_07910 [Sulfurimonas lithotrophica]|uniref:Uncharacterized protein n=1 Tax=Sulfurimonas lithotrophica TaxID=2590022 RepID=A0A5P8P260_9BACT|nr:hypothetical protein [Sulfurimonas lithotrophica]QFR49660.1 hypothetical protein FJR48_07910 [Sulfurimonas lithotrophica]
MAYILGLIVVGLFFLSLHYFTELNHKQKVLTSSIVLAIILGAIAFNTYSDAQRDNMMAVVTKFNQGKTINCNGIDVNSSLYDLSTGTFTFIGRENTPNYGQMISASSCK